MTVWGSYVVNIGDYDTASRKRLTSAGHSDIHFSDYLVLSKFGEKFIGNLFRRLTGDELSLGA